MDVKPYQMIDGTIAILQDVSWALQRGVTIEVIREAIIRQAHLVSPAFGRPSSKGPDVWLK